MSQKISFKSKYHGLWQVHTGNLKNEKPEEMSTPE